MMIVSFVKNFDALQIIRVVLTASRGYDENLYYLIVNAKY